MKERIYISIPISGLDEGKQREKAVSKCHELFEDGYEAINPFLIGYHLDFLHRCFGLPVPTWDDYMHYDLKVLATCQVIYMCKGWEQSKGCIEERNFAVKNNIKIIYEE